MHWKLKAAIQGALSVMPLGDQFHYLMQRHISKTLPSSSETIDRYIGYANEHLESIRPHIAVPLPAARFYEFGVGRELIGPLAFAASGIRHQQVVDIQPLVKWDLVRLALRHPILKESTCKIYVGLLEAQTGASISYIAPCDARNTGLPSADFDCITSTNVLEHIPEGDILPILRECHRLLKPDGVMSFRVDYDDHYSKVDPTLSPWNFLRYSDSVWRWFNPRLHYQNRLIHAQYLSKYEKAGFYIVSDSVVLPAESEIAALKGFFASTGADTYGFSMHGIGIHNAHTVLKKS